MHIEVNGTLTVGNIQKLLNLTKSDGLVKQQPDSSNAF